MIDGMPIGWDRQKENEGARNGRQGRRSKKATDEKAVGELRKGKEVDEAKISLVLV
jgi:hypothetical protein